MGGEAVKTAVYNRYWSTGGGAEKYGGVIAQILSGDGPLDLLTHEPVDVEWLADRLRAFVDLNPAFEDAVERIASFLARDTDDE